ncbi:hypothetical protein QCA50_001542 [Cerrena zonata]|uniref:Uncharacterized protein n=1 Tax=Cerrena zonata TaxID=2478898 RepID=A0AAW0GLM8_9APHY
MLDVESILKFGMEYVMRLLLTRFFGALWIILAHLGWKSQETISPSGDDMETVDVDEEDAEEEQADVPHVDDERLSEATAVDGTDGGEEIPEEVTEHVVKEIDTKTEPSSVVSRPAYFAATVLNQAAAFVVCSSFVDGKPASPNLAVVFDGQPINNFKMEALSASSKSETTIHLVTFDGTASGGKVELMLN